jgi:hypothetical protein
MAGIKAYSPPGTISGPLTHTGTTVGFYAATPVTRPAAYTLTFSETSRTLPASTATGGGTLLTEAFTQITALVADLTATKKVLAQLVKDLQSVGLCQ